VKVRSGHIVFDRNVTYKQLLPAFRSLFLKFLEETQQLPEDPESLEVLLEENLRDLRHGRKPEGYNREGTMRLIFPITDKRIEMYVYSKTRTTDVPRVVDMVSRMLQKARLKHTIEWDKLVLYQEKRDA
jgi:mRNA-degrading endonuclease RelE of RelBE toxin-antitoxin system